MDILGSPCNADDDEAQNSNDENCQNHILPPSTQTSNLTNNKRLYFDSDDGRKNDIDYGCTPEKRPLIMAPVSSVITCVESYLDCDRESRLPSGEHSAQTSHVFEIIDDIELDDDGLGTDLSTRSYISNGRESLDLSSDDDEEYLDDNEVYAWLEEGVDSRKSGSDGETKDDGSQGPIEVQKIVLKGKLFLFVFVFLL